MSSSPERRSRFFYNYAYGENLRQTGYLYTMLEYRIDGSPYDPYSWSEERRLRPEGIVENIEAD